MNQRSMLLRKLKQRLDTATSDASAIEAEVRKLSARNYPKEMEEFCVRKLEVFRLHLTKAQAVYVEKVAEVVGTQADNQSIAEGNTHIDSTLQELESEYSAWKKSDGAELCDKRGGEKWFELLGLATMGFPA